MTKISLQNRVSVDDDQGLILVVSSREDLRTALYLSVLWLKQTWMRALKCAVEGTEPTEPPEHLAFGPGSIIHQLCNLNFSLLIFQMVSPGSPLP